MHGKAGAFPCIFNAVSGRFSSDLFNEFLTRHASIATAIQLYPWEHKILRFLIKTAIRTPKLTAAVALLLLAALAGTMTYTGFLVIGALADLLGTSRFVAGLLLGVVFARVPSLRNGKLRLAGILPKPLRRPLMLGLLALCVAKFLLQGDYVAAGFTGFATAFLVTFPWLRRAIFDRVVSSLFKVPGQSPADSADDMVIDGEFRERKD